MIDKTKILKQKENIAQKNMKSKIIKVNNKTKFNIIFRS
jgi:hypothetical protein